MRVKELRGVSGEFQFEKVLEPRARARSESD